MKKVVFFGIYAKKCLIICYYVVVERSTDNLINV